MKTKIELGTNWRMDQLEQFLHKVIKQTEERVRREMRLEKKHEIGDIIQESEGSFEPSEIEIAFEEGYNQAVEDLNKKGKV